MLLRIVPSYVTQVNQGLQDFWAKVGTSENSNVQNLVNSLVGAASTMGSSMASDLARQVSGGLAANLSALASDFTTFFLGIILAYWFAVDYPRMVRELVRIVGSERGRDVTLILAVLSRSTGGYMRGTLITSIADGLMALAALDDERFCEGARLSFSPDVLSERDVPQDASKSDGGKAR